MAVKRLPLEPAYQIAEPVRAGIRIGRVDPVNIAGEHSRTDEEAAFAGLRTGAFVLYYMQNLKEALGPTKRARPGPDGPVVIR